jgi:pyrroline-5-carboxylate reductase
MTIAIIGAGNIGLSMADGWLLKGFLSPSDLILTRRHPEKLTDWQKRGVHVTADNAEAVSNADIVVLAVKPYQIEALCKELQPMLTPSKKVISVATGVKIAEMQACLNPDTPVFRAMPNTAAAIGESVTCVAAPKAFANQLDEVKALFDAIGLGIIVDEELMEAATVLGACGIAYALRFIRANTQAGIEIGFDSKTALNIAAQMVKGAASLLLAHDTHPEQEIDKVTTPKGCTIAGLNEMEHQGFSSALIRGVVSSYRKIETIK